MFEPKEYGTLGNHKPGWLFEEYCDIDVDRIMKDLETMDPHLPWVDWIEADDSDSEVATAWKESTDTRAQEKYPGSTRGKRARIRDMEWHNRVDSYYQEIKDEYKLVGGTYTMMSPRSSYGWHTDVCIGFQIPVISNDDCAFIFRLDDNKAYSFTPKPGKAYLVNNFVTHTFINGGDVDRYYLLQIINPKNLLDKEYKPYLRHSGFPYRDYLLSRDLK